MSGKMIPSDDKLRMMYADVLCNKDVQALTEWTEPNHSNPTDEEAYLACAVHDSDELYENIERAIEQI